MRYSKRADYICAMEFYIPDPKDKNVRHRLVFEEIIICKQSGVDKCVIHLNDGRTHQMNNSIKSVYDFYFRAKDGFIMSEHSIINTRYIISAILDNYEPGVKLVLHKNQTAVIPRSHAYAYFIMNNQYRNAKTIENTDVKDSIIMIPNKTVEETIREIKEATGEVVTRRYIVKRYKQLQIN